MRFPWRRKTPYDVLRKPLRRVVAEVGIPYPNPRPFDRCSVVAVLWNEEHRIEKLLTYLQPYFSHIVLCVQQGTDRTLQIACAMAREGDVVLEDEHRGIAEASAPIVAPAVRTPWSFVLAADEWPSTDLLDALGTIISFAERHAYQGVWVPFRPTVGGIPLEEQGGNLRICRSDLSWPVTMHSRPDVARSLWWPYGHIDHERTLDELVRDYLRYFELGRGTLEWQHHNALMIRRACSAVAARRGWPHVESYDWWPRAREIAFEDTDVLGMGGASRRSLRRSGPVNNVVLNNGL